jgi:hypothetical protein
VDIRKEASSGKLAGRPAFSLTKEVTMSEHAKDAAGKKVTVGDTVQVFVVRKAVVRAIEPQPDGEPVVTLRWDEPKQKEARVVWDPTRAHLMYGS